MLSTGFKTSAACTIRLAGAAHSPPQAAYMVDISSDGAMIICPTPISVGTKLLIRVDGMTMPELPIIVEGNHGDAGNGYRLSVRLTGCAWPYEVYSTLSSLPFVSGHSAIGVPLCLKELGLELGCGVEDIEREFSRRVRLAHPDRGGDVEAFVRLRSAYLDALELVGGKR